MHINGFKKLQPRPLRVPMCTLLPIALFLPAGTPHQLLLPCLTIFIMVFSTYVNAKDGLGLFEDTLKGSRL
jgi:hypothetical protein